MAHHRLLVTAHSVLVSVLVVRALPRFDPALKTAQSPPLRASGNQRERAST
jgi:hypothetical protein